MLVLCHYTGRAKKGELGGMACKSDIKVLLQCALPPLPDLLSEWPLMSSTSSYEVQALVGYSLASTPLDSLATPSSSWALLGAGAGRVGPKVSKN